MTSTSESSTHSPVETAAVVAHGRVDVGEAVKRIHHGDSISSLFI